MKYISMIIATLALSAAAAGCGSDDPSCSTAAKKICATACACTEDGDKCAIGDQGVTVTFDKEADCVALYNAGCMQAGGAMQPDWAKCEKDLDTAPCSSDGQGQKVTMVPNSCEAQ